MVPFPVIEKRGSNHITAIHFCTKFTSFIDANDPFCPGGRLAPRNNFNCRFVGIDPCTAGAADTAGNSFETDRLDIIIDPVKRQRPLIPSPARHPLRLAVQLPGITMDIFSRSFSRSFIQTPAGDQPLMQRLRRIQPAIGKNQ